MVEALFEVGPNEYHATGEPVPITWPTLYAYAQGTGDLSEPWEYRAVIAMSRAYLMGLDRGKNIMCSPPGEWDEAKKQG